MRRILALHGANMVAGSEQLLAGQAAGLKLAALPAATSRLLPPMTQPAAQGPQPPLTWSGCCHEQPGR
jgi:hypothetical protein